MHTSCKRNVGFLKTLVIVVLLQLLLALTSQAETSLLNPSLSLIAEMLPPSMLKELRKDEQKNGVYQILFLPINSKLKNEKHVGRVDFKQRKIFLTTELLQNKDLLLRTLIHEYSHIYDFLNIHPLDRQKIIRSCRPYAPKDYDWNSKRLLFIPEECQSYRWTYTSVSTLPEFLDLAGWFTLQNAKGARYKKSDLNRLSPDLYEAKNSREFFAVNMEYFLLDAEFACRRPNLYRFLATHFNYQPFEKKECDSTLLYLRPSVSQWVQKIDLKKIYAIDYLVADSGNTLASQFGHSMLRLVICAPHRKVSGPECYEDIESHLVLTFRAAVSSSELNLWKGLVGDYFSQIFILPFVEVLEDYNFRQWRDLESYPLNLQSQQIENILYRALDLHWTYNGKYYFISHNCAVETLNLLKASLQVPLLIHTNDLNTPFGLLNLLDKAQLLTVNHKIQFPSHMKNLKKVWTEVQPSIQKIEIKNKVHGTLNVYSQFSYAESNLSLQDWLDSSPEWRQSFFKLFLNNKKTLAGFLYLENSIFKRNIYQDSLASADLQILQPQLQLGFLLKSQTYGLPQALDFKTVPTPESFFKMKLSEKDSLVSKKTKTTLQNMHWLQQKLNIKK